MKVLGEMGHGFRHLPNRLPSRPEPHEYHTTRVVVRLCDLSSSSVSKNDHRTSELHRLREGAAARLSEARKDHRGCPLDHVKHLVPGDPTPKVRAVRDTESGSQSLEGPSLETIGNENQPYR